MPEVILFVDINFGGLHTHVFESVPDLAQLSLGGVGSGLPGNATWNDIVSSFIVVSGRWQFFRDANFQFLQGNPPVFGPGLYHFVRDFQIDNDGISSVRLVGS